MKVYTVKFYGAYEGGICIVAANTLREARKTAQDAFQRAGCRDNTITKPLVNRIQGLEYQDSEVMPVILASYKYTAS